MRGCNSPTALLKVAGRIAQQQSRRLFERTVDSCMGVYDGKPPFFMYAGRVALLKRV